MKHLQACILILAIALFVVDVTAEAEITSSSTSSKLHRSSDSTDAVLVDSAATANWSYDDQSNWPHDCIKEGLTRQTPIDINTSTVVRMPEYLPKKVKGKYNVIPTSSAYNTGYTVRIDVDGASATGSPGGEFEWLQKKYYLLQWHLHQGSEHRINGKQYDMELHLVHIAKNFPKRNSLLVRGYFISAEKDQHNAFFEKYFSVLKKIQKKTPAGKGKKIQNIDPNVLLNDTGKKFYTYAGSLTTPDCNEIVMWLLFKKPIQISKAQLKEFMDMPFNKEISTSARNVQDLGKRSVLANFEEKEVAPLKE